MDKSELTIVEINGVKMEVDLRHAKIVHQNLRVGTKVKLLVKSDYNGPEVWPGVIVGFEPFPDLPTIIVAYVKSTYASAELLFAYVNSSTHKKFDLVASVDDELPVDRAEILKVFDRDIAKSEQEISEIKARRHFFTRNFNAYFVDQDMPA